MMSLGQLIAQFNEVISISILSIMKKMWHTRTGNFEGPISQTIAFTLLGTMSEMHLNRIPRCFQAGFDQRCKLSFEREK